MIEYDQSVRDFIEENAQLGTAELALILSKKNLPSEYIIHQINGRQKAKRKFPFLEAFPDFNFPSPTSVAQASSEQTAQFKVGIVDIKLERIADLSGGMGIDSYFLSQNCKALDYVEANQELKELTERNFKTLGADNIQCHNSTAEEFLRNTKEQYSLIYLDPDRRKSGKRFVSIEDCEPNVKEILPQLFEKSNRILIKYSPLLDLQLASEILDHVSEIHVLSSSNDCKEVLFLLDKNNSAEPTIYAVDYNKSGKNEFVFKRSEERSTIAPLSDVQIYLYEPNASILKAGAFNTIAERFELFKLAKNTHLYTSEEAILDFPGRKLKVLRIEKAKKGLVKRANVVNRNSGMSVDQIRKKYKIAEGGEQYLYACRLENEKRIFILAELLQTDA